LAQFVTIPHLTEGAWDEILLFFWNWRRTRKN